MGHLQRIILLMCFAAAAVRPAPAQESLPPAGETAPPPPEGGGRIVEGRPPLYTVKRNAHPLTWLELAVQPIFRSVQEGWIHNLAQSRSGARAASAVRFGAAGDGPGSGFGPLVTFRTEALGHHVALEVPLLYTYKQYQRYEFRATTPVSTGIPTKRLSFDFLAGYNSRASDQFFGLGNDSSFEEDTEYRSVTRELAAGVSAQLTDSWSAGLRGIYRNVGVTDPVSGSSTQDHFDASTVPGLFGGKIASAVVSLGRNTETRADHAFKGGVDEVEISFNRSAGGGPFEYWRFHFDSQHFLPLTADGRKVIALRGVLETNQTPSGGAVPFFDMPVLGAFETLRGFDNYRFRDKSAAAFTVEYRYRIWPAMDWGLFVDEGQVAPGLRDMALNAFHTAYGLRLFVWPKPNLPVSVDYARSSETWRLYINLNTRF